MSDESWLNPSIKLRVCDRVCGGARRLRTFYEELGAKRTDQRSKLYIEHITADRG